MKEADMLGRLLNLLSPRRRRMEQDLARELEDHLLRRIEELTGAGLEPQEARRQATLELGGVPQTQEDVRDTWTWRWLDTLGRDLRYAVRALRRMPGFALTAIISLGLGIGATAAIFSLVDQVLLRRLPVRDAGSLVQLVWRGRALGAVWGSADVLSYPTCLDLQAQRRFFDGAFCRYPSTVNLSTGDGHVQVRAELVSGSFFPVLDVRPEAGRLIEPSDDTEPLAHPVVVLSHPYWKHSLGGAADVVGRKLLVNNYPMTVIGVAAESFRGVDPLDVPAMWIPATMKRVVTPEFDLLLERRAYWMHVFARLKPGVTATEADQGLRPWFRTVLEEETRLEGFPPTTEEQRRDFLASSLEVQPATRGRAEIRESTTKPLQVMMASATLLLLLAVLNVAGLLVARGAARSRELTTRLALGASRGRIWAQVMVEAALIALGGGLLGLVAAPVITRALISLHPAQPDVAFRLDARIFLFALAVCAVAALLAGLGPAFQAGRIPLIASLKDRSRVGGGTRLRRALVIGQVAFTLVLLVGAGLFVQTVRRLLAKGPGFPTSSLVMFRIDPPSLGVAAAEAERVMQDVLRRVRSLPGVERASAANTQILSGGSSSTVFTLALAEPVVTERVLTMRVGPGFFSTLGAELVAGRDFDEREMRLPGERERAARAIIVNESFAKRYFGDRDPIGQRVGQGNRPGVATNTEIIGVVRDFNRRTLREDSEQAFVSFWDRDSGDGAFYVRVRGDPAAVYPAIRAAVREVASTLPVTDLTTVDEQVARSLYTERMLATLSSAFGLIALLLSMVGLYGVMAFIVTRRTQEIGVRLALGATRSAAVWLVVRDALVMIAAGAALALPAVWALGRLVQAQLFGVTAVHGPTIALASGLLAVVALGASMFPAWRAASVSPTEALRFE
jgi:predicted permease